MTFALDINTVWFFLLGVLLTGYAVLDGFDLGVGALHLTAKTDEDRRKVINSIGPVWDGNEVWLVTGGGALFAAFPEAYATAFSGFYLALFLLLMGLICRAMALEFRGKQPMKWWRSLWDKVFSIASIISALLMGVALGNIVLGIPLNANHDSTGTFFSLLRPYPLVVGITVLMLFIVHGALFLLVKNEGELYARLRALAPKLILVFYVLLIAATAFTFMAVPHLLDNLKAVPVLFAIPVLAFLAAAYILVAHKKMQDVRALLSSAATIALLFFTLGLGLYPNLIISTPEAANGLTIYNAASSEKTLYIMLLIAGIGMPLVIGYTTFVYRAFRGKVKLDEHSY
jgi:cytochrome bd ubiquinol oxidase subunit II